VSAAPVRRVTVVAEGDGYRSRVVNDRGQQTYSDEPPGVGGKGEGFGPFELLASALATCTVATLRMYANRKKWPLKNLQVEVVYHRAGEDDLPGDGPDRIIRRIRADNRLSTDQLGRLGEIAQRCPVARALGGTSLKIADEPVDHLVAG